MALGRSPMQRSHTILIRAIGVYARLERSRHRSNITLEFCQNKLLCVQIIHSLAPLYYTPNTEGGGKPRPYGFRK